MPNRRAADLLAETLIAYGVDRVFCVPGESHLALLDAFVDRPQIQLVIARHESGAGFMAMADGRCTRRPGVCLVSRGPGATNAAIAVHSADQDAAPLVLIIGQVSRADCGRGAFQEIDYEQMFGGIAKSVWQVTEGVRLPEAFARAFELAMSDTPGPVVIAVPEDVFDDLVEPIAVATRSREPLAPSDQEVDCVAEVLATAERPLMIAGAALDAAPARAALHRAAHHHRVPVALSYKRQDLFDSCDALFAGYLGFAVPRAQVDLLCESDAIVALGTRLGDITTQHYRLLHAPRPDQRLVHVHPDGGVVGRLFQTDVPIVADPAILLERLAARPVLQGAQRRTAWAARLHGWAAHLASYSPTPRADGVEFGAIVQAIGRHAARDAVVSIDGGNFGGWVHRLWPWTAENRIIGTASGAMGMGVPGAVAAALRFPGRQVVAFVGDGGFMMTGAEIATAVRHETNIVIVVSNNRCYGTIRQQQQRLYPGRAIGADLGAIDFAAMADACGARGFHVRSLDEVEPVVDAALAHGGVTLIDVATSLEAISAYTV